MALVSDAADFSRTAVDAFESCPNNLSGPEDNGPSYLRQIYVRRSLKLTMKL